MARTTSSEVQEIIKIQAGYDLDPFITAANELVTEVCDVTAAGYTDARLALIETWLAAHFYAQYDPRSETEKADVVSRKRLKRADLGFNNTHYGQMAMRLDTYGGLAAINDQMIKGGKAVMSVTWVGKTELEQGRTLAT